MFAVRLSFVLQNAVRNPYAASIFEVHTQICQPVVESSPSMIEALVCYGQPFDLVAQHLVSSGS